MARTTAALIAVLGLISSANLRSQAVGGLPDYVPLLPSVKAKAFAVDPVGHQNPIYNNRQISSWFVRVGGSKLNSQTDLWTLSSDMTAAGDREAQERILVPEVADSRFASAARRCGQRDGRQNRAERVPIECGSSCRGPDVPVM